MSHARAIRLKAAGIRHFRVESRIKTRESFEAKVRKDPVREVEDVVGIQVLIFFRSDLTLADQVMQRLLILDSASYVDKSDLQGDGEFGYRSIQFVGRTTAGGENALPPPIWEVALVTSGQKVEVQIRTLWEHGFAEVEHDLRYKTAGLEVSAEAHRKSALTAALLEQADTNLDDTRTLLHLGEVVQPGTRAANIEGRHAERFTQSSRASTQLDHQVRVALDLERGYVLKSAREVGVAASPAGWTKFTDYQNGVENYGELGRRLVIACADTSRGVVLIDFEPQLCSVGYLGIDLYWTSLAVALGINVSEFTAAHGGISNPDGRRAEFKTVAKHLVDHPGVPATTVRDRYRHQAPAGLTESSEFREIEQE